MSNTTATLHNSARSATRRATICGFLLLITGFCGLHHDAGAQSAPSAHRIMVFGDSLSAAYNIDPAQGWVALLGEKVKKQNAAAKVINASISGETTQGGRARLATDLGRHKPTIVLLELGANDALRGLPLADTRRNLEAMLADIRRAGATPILIGVQIPPNYGPQYAQEFRDLFGNVARATKTPLVPFLMEGMADKRELFLPDGLHPSAQAQPILLNNVWPVVEAALRAKVKP